ncbi:asparaginase [Neisseria musculi]|uniref:Asparaginase family protein n=1 Tax=Neisseria musculi TaxID=1815583 RepID=A0A7H1M842_9NEIS|nr:asparaginase [Neisseria musculi]QNT57807.1 asparaginase family protein [Neisseria musculi]
MHTLPSIFVLYTGGTIGMSQSRQGLRPDAALAGKALLPFAGRFRFDWHLCDPLIDSSAVTLADWQSWLQLVAEKIPQYNGVLVLHGTDTLAYAANLFALALQGLDKPVVLTGSQLPYDAENSDAPLNLATAVTAFELDLRETVIAFNGKLFPAVGSSKTSTESAEGFSNPHFGTLAQWSPEQGWDNVRIRPSEKTGQALQVRPLNPQAKVICTTLIPGFAAQACSDGLDRSGADAVVLQSYGHGNAPADAGFIDAVRRFTAKGGLLLNISQVPQGNAAAVYAQGSALRGAGVVNGGKANLETAAVLLTLAVGSGWTAGRLQQELLDLGLVEEA